jgi:hypothetical protein
MILAHYLFLGDRLPFSSKRYRVFLWSHEVHHRCYESPHSVLSPIDLYFRKMYSKIDNSVLLRKPKYTNHSPQNTTANISFFLSVTIRPDIFPS